MALDFPASSASPYTAPNGVIYTWNTDGYWEAKADPNDFDTDYLKLDATNGPVTGPLTFEGLTTHEDGVSVTGGDTSSSEPFTLFTNTGSAVNTRGIRFRDAGATEFFSITYKDQPNGYLQVGGNPAGAGNSSAINLGSAINAESGQGNHVFISNDVPATGRDGGTITDWSELRVECAFDTPADVQSYKGILSRISGSTPQNSLLFCAQDPTGTTPIPNTTGFYSNIINGTNTYNFYAAGSAPNYFSGITQIGATPGDDPLAGGNFATITPGNSFTVNVAKSTASAGGACLGLNRVGAATGRLITFLENSVVIDAIKLDGSGGITYGVSDYRLKENIVDLPSATDAIKALRPVNFNFKTHPGKTRPGFIAHEIADVLPAAVTGTKDATEAIGALADYDGTVLETEVTEPEELEYTEEVETDGVTTATVRTRTWTATGTQPVYQGVDQTKLIPLLTKALQEALNKIETLETRLSDAGIA